MLEHDDKNFSWIVNDSLDSVAIVGYRGGKKEVVLPTELGDLPVRKIVGKVFDNNRSLRRVVIPEGVQEISGSVFSCSYIEQVDLPASMTNIDVVSLSACQKMKNINVDPANPVYFSKDGVLFKREADIERLLRYPAAREGRYDIPSGTTHISPNAFELSNIENVTLPETLVTIGSSAFAWCEKLQSVSIPDSVRRMGAYAFLRCSALTDAKLSKNVRIVPSFAFAHDLSLSNVTIPEGVEKIDLSAFMNCRSLEDIAIPQSVRMIASLAFMNCVSLKNVELPKEHCSISVSSFSNTPREELNGKALEGGVRNER
jgi:hypothetical protein